ncbi:MAG: DUF2333 family protein [Chromatiales bacterium]|nr:DUF2333 family protein [Chromatiales bacterium]
MLAVIAEYWGQEPDRFDVMASSHREDAKVQNPKELPLGIVYLCAPA